MWVTEEAKRNGVIWMPIIVCSRDYSFSPSKSTTVFFAYLDIMEVSFLVARSWIAVRSPLQFSTTPQEPRGRAERLQCAVSVWVLYVMCGACTEIICENTAFLWRSFNSRYVSALKTQRTQWRCHESTDNRQQEKRDIFIITKNIRFLLRSHGTLEYKQRYANAVEKPYSVTEFKQFRWKVQDGRQVSVFGFVIIGLILYTNKDI